MKVMKITKTVVKLTADEGKWLTRWTEEQDIIYFSASKIVSTSEKQASNWREITDEEYQSLKERLDMALAQQTEEEPLP